MTDHGLSSSTRRVQRRTTSAAHTCGESSQPLNGFDQLEALIVPVARGDGLRSKARRRTRMVRGVSWAQPARGGRKSGGGTKLEGAPSANANCRDRLGLLDSGDSGAVGADVPTVGPPRRLPRVGSRLSSTDDCDGASELCSSTRLVVIRETCGKAARTKAVCVPTKASTASNSRAILPRATRPSRRKRITGRRRSASE